MKVIKPLKLGMLHRTYENDGRCQFVPTLLLCFPFEAPSVAMQEVHLWKLAAEELGKDAALDEGMPKARGEVLVSGKAYPPGGEARTACAVRVQLGSVDKRIFVVGDRRWHNGVPTDPVPFSEMPIDWPRAFGGEGFAANPVGLGAALVIDAKTGARYRPLPNLEDPKKLITSEREKPGPVGLGAVPLQWPQRMKKAGTYDQRWQKERYPGLPEDIDWSFFNMALEDQWIEGHFKGDEAFVIENMHPTHSKLESRLPGFSTRCFITRDNEDGVEEFREVPMRIDTVLLFPNAKRGVVVFRGTTEVAEDDAADVKHLVAAAERMGEPRPASHYRAVLARRLDKETAALHALRESDLFPPRDPNAPAIEGETLGDMEELVKIEALVAANQRRQAQAKLEAAREELRAHDIDPDLHLPKEVPPAPPPPPDNEDLAEYIEGQLKLAEEQRIEADQKKEEALAEARRLCAEHDIDFDALAAKQRKKDGGPPSFSADEELEKIFDQVELGRNAGMPIEAAEARIRDPELFQKLQECERQLKDAYRKFAHRFPAACSLETNEAARLRAEVEASLAAGRSLAGRDLTGADLSGISFRGANLEGAFLEGANLSEADLQGANLRDAVLTRADLTAARFAGAVVEGTNFGEAKLHRTDLSGGLDLTRAVFTNADLVEANLCNARLDGADFMDARFSKCNLTAIKASKLNFILGEGVADEEGIDFAGSDFRGAQLHQCNFLYADLSGCDLSGVSLRECVMLGTKLDGVNLDGADATQLRVVHGSSMCGASLRGTTLTSANLRSTNLKGSDFSDAELTGADLSASDLEGAKLCRVNAPGLLMMKANLKNADLTAANLMQAILQKSNIEGACFKGANLFRVDFAKIKGNVGTTFDGANMDFIRFVERRDG